MYIDSIKAFFEERERPNSPTVRSTDNSVRYMTHPLANNGLVFRTQATSQVILSDRENWTYLRPLLQPYTS